MTAAYGCSDEGSGVASCSGTVPNGSALDTGSVGTKTFTAADNAGNSSTTTVSYKVVYNFKGFFAPVRNAPALNQAKAGAVVPFSFTLGGNYGRNVVSSARSVPINCTTLQPLSQGLSERVQADAGLSAASYSRTPVYLYLWATAKPYKNTCRQFTLTLNDTTEHRANFRF